MIALQQALADLGTLGLDDEARALFPTGNAERLFKLAGRRTNSLQIAAGVTASCFLRRACPALIDDESSRVRLRPVRDCFRLKGVVKAGVARRSERTNLDCAD